MKPATVGPLKCPIRDIMTNSHAGAGRAATLGCKANPPCNASTQLGPPRTPDPPGPDLVRSHHTVAAYSLADPVHQRVASGLESRIVDRLVDPTSWRQSHARCTACCRHQLLAPVLPGARLSPVPQDPQRWIPAPRTLPHQRPAAQGPEVSVPPMPPHGLVTDLRSDLPAPAPQPRGRDHQGARTGPVPAPDRESSRNQPQDRLAEIDAVKKPECPSSGRCRSGCFRRPRLKPMPANWPSGCSSLPGIGLRDRVSLDGHSIERPESGQMIDLVDASGNCRVEIGGGPDVCRDAQPCRMCLLHYRENQKRLETPPTICIRIGDSHGVLFGVEQVHLDEVRPRCNNCSPRLLEPCFIVESPVEGALAVQCGPAANTDHQIGNLDRVDPL